MAGDDLFFGSKSGKYKRTADNLFSTDMVEVLFGISEGPIKGLKNGAKSFYVGDTTLEGIDGSSNFEDFQLNVYTGVEAGQPIKSLMGGFGSSTSVGTSLAEGISVTRSGTHTGIDYLDIRFMVNALFKGDKKGEHSHSGEILIEYKRSSSATWQRVSTVSKLSASPVPVVTSGKDPQLIIQSTTPGTAVLSLLTDVNRPIFWLDSGDNLKAYQLQGSSWVLAPASRIRVYTGARAPFTAADSPTNRASVSVWLKNGERFDPNMRFYFNGTGWAKVGSSTKPSKDAKSSNTPVLVDGIVTMSGKTTTGWVQEYRIPVANLDDDTYDIRVTLQAGANWDQGNKVGKFEVDWESFQEILAKDFNFPGLACVQVAARASDQFSSVPEMSGVFEGRVVRVPSNYNPDTRVHAGVWDGTWKLAYTNNAAYVGYDLVMNNRYGMNAYYPVTLNKWDVYDAGVWCDTRAADGTPRFTFNGVIDSPRNGREAINYIFGLFGGRFIDDGNGQAVLRIDRPTTPVAIFAPENVEQGTFAYSFSPISSQNNDITVTYINPDMNWQEDRRRVHDQPHIDQYGRVPLNFAAVGCTNSSEAVRRARYQLVTSLTERTTVAFKTNRMGKFVVPYDIILVSDEDSGFGYSGRVRTFDHATRTVTFRDPIFLEAGVQHQIAFTVPTPDHGYETFTLNVAAGQTGLRTSIRTQGDLPSQMAEDIVFSVGSPKPFRVMTITPEGDETIAITALEVNRLKWSYIDGHVDDIPYDFSDEGVTLAPLPVNKFEVEAKGQAVTLSWGKSPSKNVREYELNYSRNGDAMRLLAQMRGTSFTIPDLDEGDYLFSVAPIGVGGQYGPTRYAHFEALWGEDDDLPLLENVVVEPQTGLNPDGSFFAFLTGHWTPLPAVIPNVRYVVEYKAAEQSMYTRIEVREAAFRTDLLKGATSYNVRVSAYSGNMPIRGATMATVVVPGDDTIPPVPTGWTGVSGVMQIELSGDPSTELDFASFRIYSSRYAAGPWAFEASIAGTSYTRQVPRGDLTEFYRVTQTDRSGNESPPTNAIQVRPSALIIDDEPPAVPTGLALDSTTKLGTLIATWDANTEPDFAYYDVEIRVNGGNALSFTGTANRWEWTLPANTPVSVRLRAVDRAGNKSAYCASVAQTTARDTTPPAVPTGLAVRAGFETLWVNWNDNTESDLSHYELHQSNTNTAPAIGVVGRRVTDNSVIITGLAEALTQHFWVRAVDTSGNKSAWSARVQGTTSSIWTNVNAPAVPTGLALTSRLTPTGAVLVATWNASANAATYELTVTEAGGGPVTFPASADRVLEIPALRGVQYSVTVRALNAVAQRSAASAAVNHTVLTDTVAPGRPTGLVLKSGFNQIFAEWGRNSEPDLAYYEVAISSTSFSEALAPTLIEARTAATAISIAEIPDGEFRYIRVRAVDTSGNLSPWSVVVGRQVVALPDFDFELTTADLAGLVDSTSFAAGIGVPEIMNALPGAPHKLDRLVYLTTNNQLYRNNGSGWVAQSVDATQIVGRLIAGQIGAGAIGAEQLAAQAIVASKFAVMDYTNLLPDPGLYDRSLWEYPGNTQIQVWNEAATRPANVLTTNYLRTTPSGSNWTPGTVTTLNPFVVEPGTELLISGKVWNMGGSLNGAARIHIAFFNAAGAQIGAPLSTPPVIIPAGTGPAEILTVSGKVPAEAVRAALRPWTNGAAGAIVGWGDFLIQKKTGSVLIENGAVTAEKVQAKSMTARELAIGDFANYLPDFRLQSSTMWTTTQTTRAYVDPAGAALPTPARLGGGALVFIPGANSGQINYVSYPFEVNAGDVFHASMDTELLGVDAGTTATGRMRFVVNFMNAAGGSLGSPVLGQTEAQGRTTTTGERVVPEGAVKATVTINLQIQSLNNERWAASSLVLKTKNGAVLIQKGAISAEHVTLTGNLITVGAQIKDAIITNAHITSVSAAKLTAGTALAGSITVNNEALSTIESRAANPAARVNAGTTKIDPGMILISGTTTLADWRMGGDQTRINGGALSANSVTANSLAIGLRNITLTGIKFEHNSPAVNQVSWTAGHIRWINDANATVSNAIATGTATWTSGVLYLYWAKDTGVIAATTAQNTAFAKDNLILATYQGGLALDADYGKTIIDGAEIKTGTITATQLIKTQALITETLQVGAATITDAAIVELDAAKIIAGTTMSGEVIVDGNPLAILAGDTVFDTMDLDWTKVSGVGTGVYLNTPAGQDAAGRRYLRAQRDGVSWWRSQAKMAFDPEKLYRVTFFVKRGTGVANVTGAMYLGVQGFAGDKTTRVNHLGAEANGGHWGFSNVDQKTVPAEYTVYSIYIKGRAATGGSAGGAGAATISNPMKLNENVKFISPLAVFNHNLTELGSWMMLGYSKIEVVDEDAAAVVNAGSVRILPGMIEIQGATTLADWRMGGDKTTINGGVIEANTIKANSLEIGSRNVTLIDIQFEHNSPSTNQVSWTAGSIRWINDAGVATTTNVPAGTGTFVSGQGVIYIYWPKPPTGAAGQTVPFVATNNAVVPFNPNNLIVATYRGGRNLDADYGKTVIDGADVKTGTLTADRVNSTSFRNSGLAVFDGTLQSDNFNAANNSGWRIMQNGTMNMPAAVIKSAHIGQLQVDTIHVKDGALTSGLFTTMSGGRVDKEQNLVVDTYTFNGPGKAGRAWFYPRCVRWSIEEGSWGGHSRLVLNGTVVAASIRANQPWQDDNWFSPPRWQNWKYDGGVEVRPIRAGVNTLQLQHQNISSQGSAWEIDIIFFKK